MDNHGHYGGCQGRLDTRTPVGHSVSFLREDASLSASERDRFDAVFSNPRTRFRVNSAEITCARSSGLSISFAIGHTTELALYGLRLRYMHDALHGEPIKENESRLTFYIRQACRRLAVPVEQH